MSKSPFVNCKSRKRRKQRSEVKTRTPKQFCPQTMICFNNSPNEYSTVWCCRICLTCILSKSAVVAHIKTCKKVIEIPVPLGR